MLHFPLPKLLLFVSLLTITSCVKKNKNNIDASDESSAASNSDGAEIAQTWSADLPPFHLGATQSVSNAFTITIQPSQAGATDFEITNASFSSSEFEFLGGSFPGTGGTCQNAVSGSCTLVVKFSADEIKRYTADLIIETNRGQLVTKLAADGVGHVGSDVDGRHSGYEYGLAHPNAIAVANGKLIVAQSNVSQVIIYNTIPTGPLQKPDIVIGQPSFFDGGLNGNVSALNLGSPTGVAVIGDKLFISDMSTDRIMAWNKFPSTLNTPANYALGVPDLISSGASSISAETFFNPRGIASDGSNFAVADYDNNRVLIWNSIPSTFNQNPDVVLGQPDFESNTENNGGISASSLNKPSSVLFHGGKLFVSDRDNHRVLIFNSIPTSNNSSANVVIGQPDFVSGSINNGGLDGGSLAYPTHLEVINGDLFVPDSGNDRVLVFSGIPTVNNTTAAFALGQPDLTSNLPNNGGRSYSTMYSPYSVASDGSKLFVADRTNHRILVWNTIPNSSGEAADFAIGQFTGSAGTQKSPSGGLDASTLIGPNGIRISSGKLLVADANHGRVQVWNQTPIKHDDPAQRFIGKTGPLESYIEYTPNSSNLRIPRDVIVYGAKTIVSDTSWNRILIWESAVNSDGQSADLVIGQPDFTTTGKNTNGLNNGMYGPQGLAIGPSGQLIVADALNNRVLVWNTFPTASNTPPDFALGQPDLLSNTKNNGGRSASTLQIPRYVSFIDGKLIVADTVNRRMLIWSDFPTSSGEPADGIYGQEDFEQNLLIDYADAIKPYQMTSYGGRLYVAGFDKNRVLVWDKIPMSNNDKPSYVVGQRDFTQTFESYRDLGPASLFSAYGVAVNSKGIYVSDANVGRIIIFPHPDYK